AFKREARKDIFEPDPELYREYPRHEATDRKADVEELRRRIVDFDYMINNFYRLRDLGDKGFPRRARLEKLGLSDMADALEKV
ncbi:MAG: aldehyde ferredoxin oxidoreductase C-terminal domain-containing protein, partial [Actinobacteria bacterium]|nr:aldehyde ferredoxin oxidoreductase C-terminal domain-containing protein [Actinomycetota bacterium]